MKTEKPLFSKSLFWDVDYEKIDYEKSADWVIERVFVRGDVEDIKLCIRYFGLLKVHDTLLEAKEIGLNRIHLISAIIDEPLEKFRCYTLRQLNPGLYPY